MKKIISAFFVIGMGLAGDLKIGIKQKDQRENANAYGLSCDGARGAVKYYVEGLPNGVNFADATINISNFAKAGTYNIRVRAIDEFGQSAERIITLTIAQNTVQGGNINLTQNGQFTAQQISGQLSVQNLGQTVGANGAGLPPIGQPSGGQPPAQNLGQTLGANGAGLPPIDQPNNQAPGRLNNILSSFSSTETVKIDYGNTGRYPEPNFPTNPDRNLINPLPVQIENDRAIPSPLNRNPITSDDVTLRAASERHQNAIRGITNLLKIIDQAKANKDKAQSDIQTYTQAYNDAVAAQRAAQNDIITAQTKVSQIVSAINSLTATVDDLRNKINQIIAQRDTLTREKQTIIANITDHQAKKADLLEQLKGLDNKVGQRVKDLSDKNAECQSLNDAVNNKARQLGAAQQQLANSETVRANIVIDVANKAALVDDLRRQLQQAERQLADAKIRLADIDAKRLALPVQIANLKRELEVLQAKAKACADQVANLQAIIDNLKGDNYKGLTNDIKNLDNKIGTYRSKVSEIDAQLAATQGPLEDLKAKLGQATEDLAFLRTQKTSVDATLRIAYQRGNDVNNRVAFAKQNIDAIIKRFQDESKIISDATLNLERARAEQALARLGLEEIIAHYSDALPYAIVPNGNGKTNPGTPFGNNPSGSPLGPIQNNGNGAPGSFRINSWTNYLSSAYGAGVNPSFVGSVNELFPFNFLSNVSGNLVQGTNVVNGYGNISNLNGQNGQNGQIGGGCGVAAGNINQRVATGVVVEVRDDSFDLRANDGQVYAIKVAPCTRLNANKPNFKLQKGHEAVVKGIANLSKEIQGDQITCLQ